MPVDRQPNQAGPRPKAVAGPSGSQCPGRAQLHESFEKKGKDNCSLSMLSYKKSIKI